MQAILHPGDVVLFADDWAERGRQAIAARTPAEMCGARFRGSVHSCRPTRR